MEKKEKEEEDMRVRGTHQKMMLQQLLLNLFEVRKRRMSTASSGNCELRKGRKVKVRGTHLMMKRRKMRARRILRKRRRKERRVNRNHQKSTKRLTPTVLADMA